MYAYNKFFTQLLSYLETSHNLTVQHEHMTKKKDIIMLEDYDMPSMSFYLKGTSFGGVWADHSAKTRPHHIASAGL